MINYDYLNYVLDRFKVLMASDPKPWDRNKELWEVIQGLSCTLMEYEIAQRDGVEVTADLNGLTRRLDVAITKFEAIMFHNEPTAMEEQT